MKLRIAVCEDEKVIRESIAEKIHLRYPKSPIVQYETGESLLSEVEGIDIVFLDIHLEDLNGLEVAKRIREKNDHITIIFITAYEKYVYDAFDVRAFQFLVKPIDSVKFYKVLQSAVENIHIKDRKEEPFTIIKKGHSSFKIYHHQICYAEVLGRRIQLYTVEGLHEFNGKLAELEKSLGSHFYRIHRSYLVNLNYISSYDAAQVSLDQGQQLVIAQKKYADFVRAYLQFMKSKGQ
ncbi:LytTR family two component transcriptional regulator [Fontibacillus phaseoli]|uniref:LytTR family two component transcriptional regulator n=1 Tax=Fontibacillus phaseoli TaxID=1416533 RepID=A0A369B4E5_9BACL|nr:LytTR family DNA-binding domain-containing protein [Fontibacillus phaseoli]RCX16412.1 LytTR family two component transcriptional regulator [Fontibacillus phaseoli]